MNVTVVGGGIVGLFTAYFLNKEGVDVTIVECDCPCLKSSVAAGIIEPHRLELMNNLEYIFRYFQLVKKGAAVIKDVDFKWIINLIKLLNKKPSNDLWREVKWIFNFSLSTYEKFSKERNDFEFKITKLLKLIESRKEVQTTIKEFEKTNTKFEIINVKGFISGFC